MPSHSPQIRALVAAVVLAAGGTVGIADASASTVKHSKSHKVVEHRKAHKVTEQSKDVHGHVGRPVWRLSKDPFPGLPSSTPATSPTAPTSTSSASPAPTPTPSTSPSSTSTPSTSTPSTSTSTTLTTPSTTLTTPTTPSTTLTTPTTTTTTTTTPTTSLVPVPEGVSGSWNLSFDDEFNGTSLDTSAWSTHDGWTNQNGVTDEASNVSVSGGYANLTLSSATSGATISTNSATLGVGDYAEARISMPGSGSTMNDWDAFWASGPAWPAAGENDVTESLGGESTVNYHSPSGAHNQGAVSGDWADGFHTYGIYRGSDFVDVYRDGLLVKSYSTDDNGQPETFIFTVGNGQGDPVATGAAGTMKVDYLRVWTPAS